MPHFRTWKTNEVRISVMTYVTIPVYNSVPTESNLYLELI